MEEGFEVSDPLELKKKLEQELHGIEAKLEERTRSLQEKLREVQQLQQTIQPSSNFSNDYYNFQSQPQSSTHFSTNGKENKTTKNLEDEENNFFEENHENSNIIETNPSFQKMKEKENFIDEEMKEMKEKLIKSTNEKLEYSQMKKRYLTLLDEERQSANMSKRKVKQLEAEIIELKKRINQEMLLNTQKDEQLQNYQRKFPTLLRELELTESKQKAYLKEKETLLQRTHFPPLLSLIFSYFLIFF